MRDIVITDIDHTIADAAWRNPMMAGGDWDAYHMASINDKPCEDTIEMLRAFLMADKQIIGFTVRPEKFRKLTMEKLVEWNVPMHELLMRADNNFRPAPEVKLELFHLHIKDPARVLCVIDDREDVVAAFNALGVTTLQVNIRQDK